LADYHVIATSWIGIGLGDVVFEEGVRSLWVEALLPPVSYGSQSVFFIRDNFMSCETYLKGNRFPDTCHESGPCLQASKLK